MTPLSFDEAEEIDNTERRIEEAREKRRILADFESAWNPKTAEKYKGVRL